jgi:hypothetical protein
MTKAGWALYLGTSLASIGGTGHSQGVGNVFLRFLFIRTTARRDNAVSIVNEMRVAVHRPFGAVR